MAMILFVRHGSTEWNAVRRIQGREQVPLSREGRLQIEALITSIQAWGPEAIYTSPLSRSLESAYIIAGALGLTPIPVSELTELDVGQWAGKTVEEISTEHSWITYQNSPSLATPPLGEPILNFSDRIIKGLEIVLDEGFSRTVIVTHGDVIRAAVCHYIGLPLDRLHYVKVGLGSVTILCGLRDAPRLLTLNHTSSWEEVDGAL
jgi:broad specificity phosphatase PhoE